MVVSSITDFLQSEIHDSTMLLVRIEPLVREAEANRALGIRNDDICADSVFFRATQGYLDKCERWLVREKTHIPIRDPVFQDIAWLCGLAHDVLPDAIRDAQESVERFRGIEQHEAGARQRLKYVQAVYETIHEYVSSLLKGNLSMSQREKCNE